MEGEGLGPVHLPGVYREEYLRAVERARQRHDPASDWDRFVDALWAALVSGFGLDVVAVDETEHRRDLRAAGEDVGAGGQSPREVE